MTVGEALGLLALVCFVVVIPAYLRLKYLRAVGPTRDIEEERRSMESRRKAKAALIRLSEEKRRTND